MCERVEFAGFLRKRWIIRISHALRPSCDHVYPLRNAFSSGIADHRRQCRLPYLARTANPSFSTRGVGDPGKGSRTTSWSKGLPHGSDVLVLSQKFFPGAVGGGGLGRQGEL